MIALLTTSIGCGGGKVATNELSSYRQSDAFYETPTPAPKTDLENKNLTPSIDFDGVRLQNKVPDVLGLEAVNEPAYYLEYEDDKPDSVVPRHVSIKFRGDYATRHEKSFYSPEINIYPVEEFRKALGKSASTVSNFDNEITQLRNIISNKPSKLKDVPRIPFHDGSPKIITHLKYFALENTEGITYLTHFDIEPSLVGNGRLTYVFQGLTLDNRYYIFATFPVTLDILPSSDANRFREYELPDYFYDPESREANEANFDRYLDSVAALLENTAESRFEPSLTYIDETLTTLKIAKRE